MRLTHAEVLAHLRALADGFENGDTLEGSIEFIAADATEWEVTGAYRVGNTDGQGGLVLIQQTVGDS